VRARHICSCTAHKAQGQSIKTCYVIVSEMENNPALMYVALSRAINKIVLVY
jgi:ATP-dependent exoDNAse (exonuclease V) alpha subunit